MNANIFDIPFFIFGHIPTIQEKKPINPMLVDEISVSRNMFTKHWYCKKLSVFQCVFPVFEANFYCLFHFI